MNEPSSPLPRVPPDEPWYETIEIAPEIFTPGLLDFAPSLRLMPWPEVRGRRCLVAGRGEGFFAFELEWRGADEVVSLTFGDVEQEALSVGVEDRFQTAARVLGSGVKRVQAPAGDITQERLGRFDVVVCVGTIDGRRWRDAVAGLVGACDGALLSIERIDLRSTVLHRGRPAFPAGRPPNSAGHRTALRTVGLEVVRAASPFLVPFGPGYRRPALTPAVLGDGVVEPLCRRATPGRWPVPTGVVYSAVLTAPAECS